MKRIVMVDKQPQKRKLRQELKIVKILIACQSTAMLILAIALFLLQHNMEQVVELLTLQSEHISLLSESIGLMRENIHLIDETSKGLSKIIMHLFQGIS